MRRGWRFWVMTAAIAALCGLLTWMWFEYSALMHDEPVLFVESAVQPTVEYLSANPEELPRGLVIWPPPGKVWGENLCIGLAYLPCEGEESRANLPPDQNHCGPDATISVDGKEATVTNLPADLSDYGDRYISAYYCLRQLLAPGDHVVTVDAYPMGRSARYSWVWTVEP